MTCFRVRSGMMHSMRRVLLFSLLLAAAPIVCLAQQVPRPPDRPDAKQPPAQPPRPPSSRSEEPAATFKVNVGLVSVFTTVTDESGAPVGNLTKDDFHVFEDGVEQKIAVFDRESGLPLSIVLAIDASLSTRKDLPLELESAKRFTHAILRPVDAISIYQFSQYVTEVIPFTRDLRIVDRGISRIHAQSSTALYDAIYLGSRALIPRQGRKVLVVITDGGDTTSQISYREAVRAAQTAEAIVYSIITVPIEASAGRDIGGEHALIQISRDTGGKHYYASNLNGLDKAFKQISEELRTQYLIAYYPPKRISDDFRKISVVVMPQAAEKISASELRVRHRAGYYNSKLE
jgi:Ca-activated chloride channel homolog